MLGSTILDVAIGMALIYLLLSLIASVIQEAIAAVVQSRSANLLQGLRSLFSGDLGPDGNSLLDSVYDHGLIRGLYRDPSKDLATKKRQRLFDPLRLFLQKLLGLAPEQPLKKVSNTLLLPAYIPSRTFSLALMDILHSGQSGGTITLQNIQSNLSRATAKEENADNKALQALSAIANSAAGDMKVFQQRLEDWYNDSMDRVSGWYKKYTQNILMVIGLVLAISFNVSSIRVAQTLWTNRDARQAMVDEAGKYLAAHPGSPTNAADNEKLADHLQHTIADFQEAENAALLPMGWKAAPYDYKDSTWAKAGKVGLSLVGWCITALALSLGASFWFDTLNKFMVIRGTIKPQEKSQTEASKD